MPNAKQNNEIEHINKEIRLLQDRLAISKNKERKTKKVKINFKMG